VSNLEMHGKGTFFDPRLEDAAQFPIAAANFYHDGRFATLLDVINHYNSFKGLGLTAQEKSDLVEYLMSL
jgi:hypothetical protein